MEDSHHGEWSIIIMEEAKNLYYTDPLKAAWMAREFEVEFSSHSYTDAMSYEGRLAFLDDGRPVEIAPDSLHIFEPMEGDVAVDSNGYLCNWRYGHWRIENALADEKGYEPIAPFKIIQRNGKDFFVPEVQA
jgi:hypothetical protein